MSQQSLPGAVRLRLAVPLAARDPGDEGRAATPLELFFDLVFVVAVASAADRLHHGLAEGVVAESILSYALVFFAIWWAWMNFTWFASAYDSDDVLYRVFVFVQMSGALVLAAGVPRAFDERDFAIVTFGYVVMRLALVTQWVRAARGDPPRRTTALRYAVGVSACQVGWVAALALPGDWWVAAWAVLAPAELVVPVWAEAAEPTTWHPEHIAERYGLFTIIVLGESVLAASLAVRTAMDEGVLTGGLVSVILGGLLIMFSLWWLYFDRPGDLLLEPAPSSRGGRIAWRGSTRLAFLWGYGHLVVFASAAAVGAGLALAIETAAGDGGIGTTYAGTAVSVAVVVYLLSLWALHARAADPPVWRFSLPAAAAAVLAVTFTDFPVLLVGVVLTVLVAVKAGFRVRTGDTAPAGPTTRA